MKVEKIINYVAVAIVFILWAVPVIGQQLSNEKLKAFYEARIEEQILKCESKTALLNSKFGNLRSAAEIALLKAAFLKNHREKLVQDMLAGSVGITPYKIDYYLNQRFFAINRSKEAPVAEAYSRQPQPYVTSLEEIRSMYSSYIDQCIRKCSKKTALHNSRSESLRHAAEIARLKAEFLINHRELLVQDMIIGQVEMKPYKIDHYLNQRFFAIIRSKEALVAKDYSMSD